MGLYDGFGTDPGYCSTAAMAKQLGCPVYFAGRWRNGFPHLHRRHGDGISALRPQPEYRRRYRQSRQQRIHYPALKGAIERYCGLRVLGYVPRVEGVALPERHLGLVTARESLVNQQPWRDFAQRWRKRWILNGSWLLARSPPTRRGWPPLPSPDAGAGLTLALADDEAFNFYYPDNLTLLERCGVDIVRFSPLRDSELPPMPDDLARWRLSGNSYRRAGGQYVDAGAAAERTGAGWRFTPSAAV